jgi:hypothetical protein
MVDRAHRQRGTVARFGSLTTGEPCRLPAVTVARPVGPAAGVHGLTAD